MLEIFKTLVKQINEIEKKIEFDSTNEKTYKKLIDSYPSLDYVTERNLFKYYKQTNNKDIRDVIFKCHMKDVYECQIKFKKYNEDLISEGNVLLLQLIKRYDYTIPYTSFKDFLRIRLQVFYNEIACNDDAFNKTKMNLHELASLESKGINITKNTIEDNTLIEKEEISEPLIIVKNYVRPLKIVKKIQINIPYKKTGNDLIDY